MASTNLSANARICHCQIWMSHHVLLTAFQSNGEHYPDRWPIFIEQFYDLHMLLDAVTCHGDFAS